MNGGKSLDESYFSKIYDEVQKEQQRFMTDLRQTQTKTKEREYHKRIAVLQTVLMGILKYKVIKEEE